LKVFGPNLGDVFESKGIYSMVPIDHCYKLDFVTAADRLNTLGRRVGS
jgi:hypothetical protein